jgi:hypothetical protein
MKLVRPNVCETVFALSGVRLDVVAELSATPKTLTVIGEEPWLQMDGGRAVGLTGRDARCLPRSGLIQNLFGWRTLCFARACEEATELEGPYAYGRDRADELDCDSSSTYQGCISVD